MDGFLAPQEYGLLNHIPAGIFILRKDFVVLFWNRLLAEWTGIREPDIVGKKIDSCYPHLKHPKYAVRLNDIFAGGPPTLFSSQLHNHIIPAMLPDGQSRIQYTTVTPLATGTGKDFHALFVIQDVTDLTYRIRNYRLMRDQAVEEIKARETVENELRKTQDELEQRVKERTMDLVLLNEQLQREINERNKAEMFSQNILEAVDEAFLVISPDYRAVSVNSAYCRQVKLPADKIVGRHCYEISHQSPRPCYEDGEECAVRHTFETGEPHTALHRHWDREGNAVYVETKSFPLKDGTGKVVSAIEIINDITAKRALEDQLRHAQKLEAVGTLTGGIAHDFNNIMTTILGYASLFQKKMAPDDPLRTAVDHIFGAARRASNLTKSLLAFSRRQEMNPEPTDLNEIVHQLEKFILRLIGEDIELITDVLPQKLVIMADRGQIEQVAMNLCTNARDAIGGGGVITISTDQASLDALEASAIGLTRPGPYAVLVVSDTGMGMDDKTRGKIFDPFFTTKEVGKGTGLGLSIVYGIVKQHGGAITVHSEPGKGSTFKVYLPRTFARSEPRHKSAPQELTGGSATVLIAEDNADVRAALKNSLTEAGYSVVEAVDGAHAVDTFSRQPQEIHLLLFDVMLPRKNGMEAYEEIEKISPGIKVLFLSGYAADILRGKGVLREGHAFIQKPFVPDDLLRKVQEVLQ